MKDTQCNITSTTSQANSTSSKSVSMLTSTQVNGASSTVSSSSSPSLSSRIQSDEDDTVEYMEVEENATEEPSSSQQYELSDIAQLIKRPLRAGDFWFIIEKNWFDKCLTYIQSSDEADSPGQIENSSLLVVKPAPKNYSEPIYRLKPNLTENEDYTVVPEEVWNLLVDKFGTVSGIGGLPVKCAVLETAKSYLVVEAYPLELRLALYGSKEDMVAQYSRNTTLREIVSHMRTLFRVNENRPVQVWSNATLLVSHSHSGPAFGSSLATPATNNLASSSKIPTPPPPPPPSPTSSNGGSKKTSDLDQLLKDLELVENPILTLEVQNLDGTWPSSRTKLGAVTRSQVASGVPITHPGICGLMNFGNTCFMNTATQCLSNTESLTNYFLSDRHVEDINPDNPLGMRGEIARCYSEVIKAMWSGHHLNLTPREFRMVVNRFAPQFSGFAHHDCQELMAFLLDGLHEDLNRVKVKPYIEMKNDLERRPDETVAAESWTNYKRRNDSIIVDTFHAQLKSTLVCPECNLVSVTFDPFCYLTLPLPYKNERAVDINFVPALSKRPLHTPHELSFRISACTSTVSSSSNENCLQATPSNLVSVRSILLENVMIPKVGSISEICTVAAKALNEASTATGSLYFDRKFNPKRMVVANVCNNRLVKIYSHEESYSAHFEDIVVYEEDDCSSLSAESGCQTRSLSRSNGYHLPVFIRESNFNSNEFLISRPFIISIRHLTYEEIREAIFKELTSLVSSQMVDSFVQQMNEENVKTGKSGAKGNQSTFKRHIASTIQDGGSDGEASDSDVKDIISSATNDSPNGDEDDEFEDAADEEETDEGVDASFFDCRSGKFQQPNPPFTISVVNLHANNEFSILRPGVRLDSAVDTYLAVNVNSCIVSKYFPCDINKMHHFKLSTLLSASSSSSGTNPKAALSLAECINQFTLIEKLGADDPWYCPRCKKHQMASKKFDIWSLPNNLIIHLKRFSYSRSHREKLDVMVEFPIKNLDMTPYVLHNPNNQSYIYDLIAVSNHYGGLGAGHYNAYAKNFINKNWYLFDDSSVNPVSEHNVMTKSAYVLFYQRQKAPETSSNLEAAN